MADGPGTAAAPAVTEDDEWGPASTTPPAGISQPPPTAASPAPAQTAPPPAQAPPPPATPPPAQGAPPQQSLLQRTFDLRQQPGEKYSTWQNAPGNLLIGGARGLAGDVAGVGQLLGYGQTKPIQWMQQQSVPQGGMQKSGKYLEQIAEFLIPIAGEEKATLTAAKLLPKYGPIIAKFGIGAAKSMILEEVHGGDHPLIAGATGGTFEGASEALKLLPSNTIAKLIGEGTRGGDMSQKFLDIATGKGGAFRRAGVLKRAEQSIDAIDQQLTTEALGLAKKTSKWVDTEAYTQELENIRSTLPQSQANELGGTIKTIEGIRPGKNVVISPQRALMLRDNLASEVDWSTKGASNAVNKARISMIDKLDAELGNKIPSYTALNKERKGLQGLTDAMGGSSWARSWQAGKGEFGPAAGIVPHAGGLLGGQATGLIPGLSGAGHVAGFGGAYRLGAAGATDVLPGIIRGGRALGSPMIGRAATGVGMETLRKPKTNPFSME